MKILIGDDAPISRRLLKAALTAEGYEVVFAADGNEALHILEQKDAPRLVILDRKLPMADGVRISQLIRKPAWDRYVYLILLSAKGHRREIIEGLDQGADDYIIKPFHLSELRARLRSARRIIELEEQLFAARELLRTRAINDPLTGLLTHAAIQELLEKEIARASREGRSILVISANLDQLQVINDTHGFLAGDAVLAETAQRIRSSMRKYDAIGRSGGGEFLIVSPGCNYERAAVLADRLRKAVSATPVKWVDSDIRVTISLGVAAATDGRGELDRLLKAAGEALLAAKRNGRNRVEFGALVTH